MPFLFREIVFCECGRPALVGSAECRTCYEDALRRKWRDERRIDAAVGVPEPVRALNPLLRRLQAPEPEEEGEIEPAVSNSFAARNGRMTSPPLSNGSNGGGRAMSEDQVRRR